jgi:hypothetical protein
MRASTTQRLNAWSPIVLFAFVAIALAAAPWELLLPKIPVSGRVVDATTREPVAGARVSSGAYVREVDEDGRFHFDRVSPAVQLAVEAEGYHGANVLPWFTDEREIALPPRTIAVRVLDAETGQPVANARLLGENVTISGGGPSFVVGPARKETNLGAIAPGMVNQRVTAQGESMLDIRMVPKMTGVVADATTGRPIAGAYVGNASVRTTTRPDGSFELDGRPNGAVHVLAPGYAKTSVDMAADRTFRVGVTPKPVRGVYLSYYGVGDARIRNGVVALSERSDVNAVVIDVKGDRGRLAFKADVPLAEQLGANEEPTIPNVEELLAELRRKGIYTIARIVIFKDDLLARRGAEVGVDVAIRDGPTGEPWTDGEGLAWVDPSRQEVWDYNIAIARDAARRGFDEIQLDYVRFPSDPVHGGSVAAAVYNRPFSEAARVDVITTFVRRMREEVHAAGAFLGIDVFGYLPWVDDDQGIGQILEPLAEVADYVCPMLYPSTFGGGLPGLLGFPQVINRPYDVYLQSLRRAKARTQGKPSMLRPWIQYFDDYPWQTGREYRAADIAAQVRGSREAGVDGWMAWDPTNRYAKGGFGPRP